MFIKSFVTIFSVLFFIFVLQSKVIVEASEPIIVRITMKLTIWVIQAIIGAYIVVFLYHTWS